MPKRHRPGKSDSSLFAHVEEIVLATSGEDAFEIVFALAARRILHRPTRSKIDSRDPNLRAVLGRLSKEHPELGLRVPRDANEDWLRRIDAAVDPALPIGASSSEALTRLDAIFESLVPRISKGEKGQFFTPRHVVDFMIDALAPRPREKVIDPSCGSGAFLTHARAKVAVSTWGSDIDARAVRVARLAAIVQGRSPKSVVRADGLRASSSAFRKNVADVVATNPPFAGRADPSGFEVATILKAPERDTLFLERSLDLLRPGGRLGIVLPYNKAAGASFARLRGWLSSRARMFAVVALPRETFLPHTSLRTVVFFAKKRRANERPDPRERTMFVVSKRAGKDASGDPLFRRHGSAVGSGPRLDHDLDDVLAELAPFLSAEGFVT